MLSAWAADTVLDAITTRRSVRGYLDRPMPLPSIECILAVASRAPSGNNSQPLRVHVLTSPGRQRLTAAIMTTRAAGGDDPQPEYDYYPQYWPEPYLPRRRANGWASHGLLGIAKDGRDKGRAGTDEDYRFSTEREPVMGFATFHPGATLAGHDGAAPHG